jgi:hypothetical protein
MEQSIDKEIEAIKTVLHALEPLDERVRTTVLQYVFQRLGIAQHLNSTGAVPNASNSPPPAAAEAPKSSDSDVGQIHIKQFKDEKKPRSANEMAALVAYYLSHLAEEGARKDRIAAKDVETYFKIAGYPLPSKTAMTLPNAKAAGYLDASGNGEYKLNAVGHNLVVHSMPRTDRDTHAPRKKSSTRAKTFKKAKAAKKRK